MQTYVYGEKREVPAAFQEFVDPACTAVISIDMHQGHLADSPDCPCPAPRAREIVGPIDAFHDRARSLGVPIIHVRTVLRKGGIDDVAGNVSAATDRGFRWGYDLRVTGDAPRAALYAGIVPTRIVVVGLVAAGALAGLAGAIEVSASTGRLQAGLSPGYGFMAILVAWLAAGRPLGIAIASVFYAGLLNGGFSLQVSGIPPAISTILQATLLIAVLAVLGLGRYRVRLVRPAEQVG